MFVRIRRLGGLAGFDEELGAIDTARLPPPRAELVESAVAAIQASPDTLELGADFLRYELRIDHPDGRHEVVAIVDDGDLSRPALHRIKDLLGSLGATR